jgi:hypothetical protein
MGEPAGFAAEVPFQLNSPDITVVEVNEVLKFSLTIANDERQKSLAAA